MKSMGKLGVDVGSIKGRIYCLNTNVGEVLWEIEPQGNIPMSKIDGTPLIPNIRYYNGELYICLDGLEIINVDTGVSKWKTSFATDEDTGGFMKKSQIFYFTDSEPIITEKVIYIAAAGKVRALNREDGKELWVSKDFGVVPSINVVGDLVVGQMGGLFLFEQVNPKKAKQGPSGWGLPVAEKVGIRAYEWKGPFGTFAINLSDGKELWRLKVKESVSSSYKIRPGFATLGGIPLPITTEGISLKNKGKLPPLLIYEDRVVICDDENLYAINIMTGKEIWKSSIKKQDIGKISGITDKKFKKMKVGKMELINELDDSFVVVGEKGIASFMKSDGKLKWKLKQEYNDIEVADNNNIYLLKDEKFMLIDTSTGKKEWEIKIPEESTWQFNNEQKKLYIFKDKEIICYKY